MSTITIDTHKTIQKLMKQGYTEEQAEGFVDALTESELVTKTYLDSKLNELRAEMYKALLIHGLIVVATIVAVAKAF